VTTGVIYEIKAAYHQVFLSPFEIDPDWGDWERSRLLGISGRSAVVISTGCAMGPVRVCVISSDRSPGPLSDAMVDWEVGEEEDCWIEEAMIFSSPEEAFGIVEDVFVPARPGLHRVRLLARGRATNYDAVVREPTEHYEIRIWPADTPSPRLRVGNDGLL
jgi:hypothetical protein